VPVEKYSNLKKLFWAGVNLFIFVFLRPSPALQEPWAGPAFPPFPGIFGQNLFEHILDKTWKYRVTHYPKVVNMTCAVCFSSSNAKKLDAVGLTYTWLVTREARN
jgi:Fe-S cluster biosynthesis and repair protein YggX